MSGQQKHPMSDEASKTETQVVTAKAAKPKANKRKRQGDDASENDVVSEEVQNQLQKMDTPTLTRYCQDLIDRNESNTALFEFAQTLLYRRPRMMQGWMHCLDYLLSETTDTDPLPQREEEIVEEEEEEGEEEDDDDDEEEDEDDLAEEEDNVAVVDQKPES